MGVERFWTTKNSQRAKVKIGEYEALLTQTLWN